MTIQIEPGKAHYTYSSDEVIWARDNDHTPYNKRAGEVESELRVAIRAPLNSKWVNFNVEEMTRAAGEPTHKNRSRSISFSLTREQFAAIVAHVQRVQP